MAIFLTFFTSDIAVAAARKTPQLPAGVSAAQLVAVEDALYLIGGQGADGLRGEILRLGRTDSAWRSVGKLLPRKHHAAVVVGHEVVIFGGQGPRGALAEVEIFDTRTFAVRAGAPMPTPRYFISAALYRGEVFVAGGTQGWGRVSTVEIYNAEKDEWFLGEPLTIPRDTQLVVAGAELLALGGFGGKSDGNVDVIERYRYGSGWQVIGDMPRSMSAYSVASQGASMYLFGDFKQLDAAVHLQRAPLAEGGFLAKPAHRTFTPRRHAASVAAFGRVFIVGGEDAAGTALQTVEVIGS